MFFLMSIWSSLLFSFLQPMMLTFSRYFAFWTISLSPEEVMLVPPRSKSWMNSNCLVILLRPSSSIFVHHSKLRRFRYLSWFNLASPTSDKFRHSARDNTVSPRKPPLDRCLKTSDFVFSFDPESIWSSSVISSVPRLLGKFDWACMLSKISEVYRLKNVSILFWLRCLSWSACCYSESSMIIFSFFWICGSDESLSLLLSSTFCCSWESGYDIFAWFESRLPLTAIAR